MALHQTAIRPGLYAITDNHLLPDERLIPAVEAAVQGGAVMVQYRDKAGSSTLRLKQARALRSICDNAGVALIINDDAELARRVGAAGVHLGQTDGTPDAARKLLGDHAIIGVTCHADLELARRAVAAGADYLAFGRFFASATKPDAPPASADVLGAARQFDRPVVAIGGISLENGGRLVEAGADLLAVVGGLFGADDIEHRARKFCQLFERTHTSSSSRHSPGFPL
ncbi:MAG: thiamine phosphate synthase [Marinobacter sp.]|nr:thiamine phosphate synthase [Marinobacter sp.]